MRAASWNGAVVEQGADTLAIDTATPLEPALMHPGSSHSDWYLVFDGLLHASSRFDRGWVFAALNTLAAWILSERLSPVIGPSSTTMCGHLRPRKPSTTQATPHANTTTIDTATV